MTTKLFSPRETLSRTFVGLVLSLGLATGAVSTITASAQAAPAALDLQSSACPAAVKQGQVSGCVVELQNLLKQQGFNPGASDGSFGSGTATAVRGFQSSVGLVADGSVGPATKQALYTRQVLITKTTCPTLQNGSRGGCVAYLQARLNAIAGTKLAVDGKFGPGTLTAVKNFQSARCLAVDGSVGPATKTALVNDSKCASAATLAISGQMTIPNPLTQGTGVAVKGIISSGYNLTNVTAQIKNSAGTALYSKSATPNAKSFNLNQWDSALGFSKLAAGNHTYVVTAKDASGASKTLQNVSFTVKAAPPVTTDCSKVTGPVPESETTTVSVAGYTFRVHKCLANSLQRMLTAANASGHTLGNSGGYRSYETQKAVYEKNCPGGKCNPPTAKPGTSMHERGLAIDFNSRGVSLTASDYNWLKANAATYGLKPFGNGKWPTYEKCKADSKCETWHWSTNGN